jgi:hypothetical protein
MTAIIVAAAIENDDEDEVDDSHALALLRSTTENRCVCARRQQHRE